MAFASDTMFTEAIAAARAGDLVRARDLLTRLLRADSANAEYWVWMSAVVDSRRERIYCLESALGLDPNNRAALRGLVILGARKPEPAELETAVIIPRRQIASVATGPSVGSGISVSPGLIAASLAGLIVIGLMAAIINYFRQPRVYAVAPTLRPPTATVTPTSPEPTPTPTPVPVQTRIERTPIPTELAGTPLIFFVPMTPTATPVLGVTPHPSYEAYRSGLAALIDGDYEDALNYMSQVVELDPDLPDAHYFRGEALRALGKVGEAIRAYDRAILLDSGFAPAYVGRGYARMAVTLREKGELKPQDLPGDFDTALERDPLLLQAYVAKADFYASQRLWKTMEEMLQAGIDLGVQAPIMYIRLSDAQFNRANYEDALENAIRGSGQDPSLLDGYLALGRAYVELEQFQLGLWPLQTYVAYRPDNHVGWGYLGRAYYGLGEFDAAFDAVSIALEINNHYAPAYLIRGLVMMERGEYQAGLDDVNKAHQYGPESFPLHLATGRAYYLLHRFVDALKNVNLAIESAPSPRKRADAYALRALIYENTNPPLLEDAIRNWRWVLEIEDADADIRAMAEEHLAALGAGLGTPTSPAEGPTLTATPSSAP